MRTRHKERVGWPLCSYCQTRKPHIEFITERGHEWKTCHECRETRRIRRTQCRCNKCTYCCARIRKAKREAGQLDLVYCYKYDPWEILGQSNAYFLPIRLPLKEIANLYDFSR